MYQVFPNQRRHTVHDKLASLHHLRNRIAHHEPIHNRPLERLHADVLVVAGWINVGHNRHSANSMKSWLQPGVLAQHCDTASRSHDATERRPMSGEAHDTTGFLYEIGLLKTLPGHRLGTGRRASRRIGRGCGGHSALASGLIGV
jgi:hypothetical protein